MNKWPNIAQLASDVKSGKTTAQALVEKSLQLMRDAEDINSIIYVNEAALEKAKEIDQKLAAGQDLGRLAGVPFIAKDNFLTKNIPTTAGSNILKPFAPPFSATVINKLEAEGAILVAKANMDAFASGSSTENSDFGSTKNPHNTDYVPGGSSGGSAAAMALGLAPFTLGTDTGGSIRQPASYTGTVGLKPTYGLVSRYGVVAMASSTDVIGPITANVEDAALVLDVMSGKDEHDATTIERDTSTYTDKNTSIKGSRFGVIKEYMGEGVDPTVRSVINDSIQMIKDAGGSVEEVSIPELDLGLPTYYIIVPAELSSNLERFDGIRYGATASDATNLGEVYTKTRSNGFNAELKRRILIGTYVLSSGYYDAYYKKAQSVRTLLINKFNEAFEKFDFLLGPTAPSTAFKLGENTKDPLKMYFVDSMTVTVNLVGVPAISMPVGKVDDLPVGLQIIAPQRHDRDLLSVAGEVEAMEDYIS